MVRRELAREGECSLRTLVLQRAEREGRSHLGIAFARDEGREHTSARHPKEIGDHAAQLEVGILEELVHSVLALAPCLHQGDSRARHISQGTNGRRWHKAGPDEPMGQQLGDPGCIPFIRLFARAAAHLMRVADEHLDRTSEHLIDGFPIYASRNLANGGGHYLKKVAQKLD